MAMTIGERIKRLREKKGWNQTELANRSGVTQSLLSKIEKGSRPNPTMESVRHLAYALGCTTDYLVGMHEDMESEQLATAVA